MSTTSSWFTNEYVKASRIIYTPSMFARSSLIHLQETGTLTALKSHVSERQGLNSYLFFFVVKGRGTITYRGKERQITGGDGVFINCQFPYSQMSSDEDLWTLKWVHFYSVNLSAVYDKYIARGGDFAFHISKPDAVESMMNDIHRIAGGDSYIRDMELNAKLGELLAVLMEETVTEIHIPAGKSDTEDIKEKTSRKADVISVKNWLDQHYTEKITLDALASMFFINKFYLSKMFKEKYGITIHSYIRQLRITKAKGMLRFSGKSIEEIACECGMKDANYMGRIFRNYEGMSPGALKNQYCTNEKPIL